jgi:hypothetical protein
VTLVYDVLKEAVEKHRCVVMAAEGQRREVAPLAIGFKDARQMVLTFQYKGGSNSGLAEGGAWRCFPIDHIDWAKITDDPWQHGNYPIAKVEASFDNILYGMGAQMRTYQHKRR